MADMIKSRLTFKKIRFSLFLRSYAFYRISIVIKEKCSGKKVIPEISRLSLALNLPDKPLQKAINKKKTYPLSRKIQDKENIKIYLEIESELTSLARAKGNKSDFKDSDYEEESTLLSLAIERAVGNSLQKIKDDLIFSRQMEVLQRKYIYWYYKTAYKYKLPTIRIVPFILRLIASK
jgi:hypothetical protein